MQFGEALSYEEAAAQLSRAVEGGVNFFDTAEMYPVPQRQETQGLSESYLGRWMSTSGFPRDRLVVATKVAGPGQMTWIRGGPSRLDPFNITSAIEASLQRLGCDYIDLLQLHWPDRYVPMFGDWEFDPCCDYNEWSSFEAQLEALGRAAEAGKVRYIGLSNETAWGLGKFTAASNWPPANRATAAVTSVQASSSLSSSHSSSLPPSSPSTTSPLLPRPISIQNAYSLLCRTFDSTLAESCHHEGVPLLAYSPLAMGLLSGKYHCSPPSHPAPPASPAGAANFSNPEWLFNKSLGYPPGSDPDNDAHRSNNNTRTPFQDPSWRLVKYRGRYAEAEGRYPVDSPRVATAVRAYAGVAQRFQLSPVQLALAFVLAHPLVGAAVVGASNLGQMEEILSVVGEGGGRSEAIEFTDEMREAVDAVHAVLPNPTP